MAKIHRLISLFLGLFIFGSGMAHDFWMQAHPYYTVPGQTVELSLHVGNDFVGDSLPNIASLYQSFSIYQAGKESEVAGAMGRDPAGYFIPDEEGTYLIGYQSVFNTTAIDFDTFMKYLDQEGLDAAKTTILAAREKPDRIKERYMRHVKSLVQVGDHHERDDSRLIIGHDLELVPQINPYLLQRGDALELSLNYLGKPVQDILVIAFSQHQPERVQRVRSDDSGRVSIKLDQGGPWLIKAVKIKRLIDQEQEWESHWASLTFAVR